MLTRLFKSEVKVMQEIHHPNLLHLYDLVETHQNYYLVLQLCEDGDLEKLIKLKRIIPEPEAIFYLK
jgi:serine/threonine protein kinase